MKKANLVLLTCLFIAVQAVTACSQEVPDWVYPIKPGTEEWRKVLFSGPNKIYEALIIPDDVLQKMTTKQVLKAWMDFPLRNSWEAFNTLQGAFNTQTKQSSALKALLEREDAGKVILNEYKLLLSETKIEDRIIKNVKDISCVELLISQENILNKLSKNEKTNLLKFALDNEQKREEYRRGSFMFMSGILLEGRILINLDNKEFKELISDDEKARNYYKNIDFGGVSKGIADSSKAIAKKVTRIKK